MTIGVLTHEASFAAWVRDLLCFELSWFALWRMPLVPRWPVAITIAVAVRAAFVGHFSVAFYLVALGFTALLLAAGRLVLRRRKVVQRRRRRDTPRSVRAARRSR